MPRIPVTVSEDQKRRWSEEVDDNPEIDSMADLVRSAVEEFIAVGDESGSSELNDAAIDEINSSLDQLERDIANVETETKALRQENIEASEMEMIVQFEVEEVMERLEDYAPELFEELEDRDNV